MQDWAKQFVSALHRDLLKPAGFIKQGHVFSRPCSSYVERFQIQGSTWNSSDASTWRFYVNAGVFFADLPEFINRALPRTHVYGRLAHFDPQCTDDFDLVQADAEAIAASVFTDIKRCSVAIAGAVEKLHASAAAGHCMWHHSRDSGA